jgi:FdhD protein
MNRRSHHTPLQRLTISGADIQAEHLVKESAVELQALNDMNELYSFATLLATPIDLVELLAGHLISEGHATSVQREFITLKDQDGFTVSYRGQLLQNVQHRVVTSSCGACNHPDLLVEVVTEKQRTSKFANNQLEFIHKALTSLSSSMSLFQLTGGCHGSGLIMPSAKLAYVSEDIGRHNTVDKTIGKAVLSGMIDFNDTLLLLSGRCGWDIVAKAVRTGISAIASLGAFSSAAVDLARQHDITLYGFVRKDGAWKVGHSAEIPPSIDESN